MPRSARIFVVISRALHLDRHVRTVVQRGAVHLGGGGRRERLGLERGVELLGRRAQLLDDALAHLVGGERRDGVLQLGELRRHVDREHGRLARHDLADLHVGGPELLQHEPDLDRRARLLPALGQTPRPGLHRVPEAADVGGPSRARRRTRSEAACCRPAAGAGPRGACRATTASWLLLLGRLARASDCGRTAVELAPCPGRPRPAAPPRGGRAWPGAISSAERLRPALDDRRRKAEHVVEQGDQQPADEAGERAPRGGARRGSDSGRRVRASR